MFLLQMVIDVLLAIVSHYWHIIAMGTIYGVGFDN